MDENEDQTTLSSEEQPSVEEQNVTEENQQETNDNNQVSENCTETHTQSEDQPNNSNTNNEEESESNNTLIKDDNNVENEESHENEENQIVIASENNNNNLYESPIEMLTPDLIVHILSFLEIPEIVILQLVSRDWFAYARCDTLWHSFYETTNWTLSPPAMNVQEATWYDLYKLHYEKEIGELSKFIFTI